MSQFLPPKSSQPGVGADSETESDVYRCAPRTRRAEKCKGKEGRKTLQKYLIGKEVERMGETLASN